MKSRWDGEFIYHTKNCLSCNFYKRIEHDKDKIEVCGWGVAFKFLYTKEKMKKCDLLRREQTKDPSIERIDRDRKDIINMWRKIRERLNPSQLELS